MLTKLDLELPGQCPDPTPEHLSIFAKLTPQDISSLASAYIENTTPSYLEKIGMKKAIAAAITGSAVLAGASPNLVDASPLPQQELAPPPPPKVLYLGDSILLGEAIAGELNEAFTSAGTEFISDYHGGRPLVNSPRCDHGDTEKCEHGPLDKYNGGAVGDGRNSLARHAEFAAAADVIVVGLGTNDMAEVFEENMKTVLTQAHMRGMVDGKAPLLAVREMFYTDDYAGGAGPKNEALYRIEQWAKEQDMKVVILPYANAGLDLADDGIHMDWRAHKDLVARDVSLIVPLAIQQRDINHAPPPPPTPPPVPVVPAKPIEQPVPSVTPGVTDLPAASVSVGRDVLDRVVKPVFSLPAGVFGHFSNKAPEVPDLPRITLSQLNLSLPQLEAPPPADTTTRQAAFTQALMSLRAPAPAEVLPEVKDRARGLLDNLKELPVVGGFTDLPERVESLPIIGGGKSAHAEDLQKSFTEALQDLKPVPTPPPAPVLPPPVVTPEVPTSPAEINFRSLYTLEPDGTLETSRLEAYISADTKTFPRPDDLRFPEGFIQIPENLPGIEFHGSVADSERFAAARTIAYIIVVSHKYQELRLKYPDLPEKLPLGDATSDHGEHSNGGDIDMLVLSNPAAQREMFMFKMSLRWPDGSEVLHHIISGDNNLVKEGDNFVASLGHNRPNAIHQANHGRKAEGYNHTHDSLDGDGAGNGPFYLPASSVGLNERGAVNLLPPLVLPPLVPLVPGTPSGNPAEQPGAGTEKELPAINLTALHIDWNKAAADYTRNNGDKPEDGEQDEAGDTDNTEKPGGTVNLDDLSEHLPDELEGNEDPGFDLPDDYNKNENSEDAESDEEDQDEVEGPTDLEEVPAPVPVPPAPTPVPTPEPALPTAENMEGDLRGRNVPEKIYNFFIDSGYTHAAAVGIMGNIRVESGFQPRRPQNTWQGVCADPPGRLEPGTKDNRGPTRGQGFGLVQWTAAELQNGLQAYADSKGLPWWDTRTQLEFIIITMQSGSSYGDLDQVLRTTNDVRHAASQFVSRFERPWPWTDRGTEQDRINEMNHRSNLAEGISMQALAGDFEGILVDCQNLGLHP